MTDFQTKLAHNIIVLLTLVSVSAVASAQQPVASPVDLVRQTVQNEIAGSNANTKLMFTDRKTTAHGSQTKRMVETRDGMAGMLVAVNDNPLTREQRRAEEARLAGLASNPDQLKRKQRAEKDDAERVTRIMKALPGAFLYEPDGTQTGNQEIGEAGAKLVRLKFSPNPNYVPPSHVEQVLTAMQGFMLIDADQHRIAKINGTLSKEVAFGWGFLGHLDRGGHFLVEQAEVIKGDWEMTSMSLTFTGKVLLFKSLTIKSDDVFSNFRAAPSNLSFAEGVKLLKKEEGELAEDQQPGTDKSK